MTNRTFTIFDGIKIFFLSKLPSILTGFIQGLAFGATKDLEYSFKIVYPDWYLNILWLLDYLFLFLLLKKKFNINLTFLKRSYKKFKMNFKLKEMIFIVFSFICFCITSYSIVFISIYFFNPNILNSIFFNELTIFNSSFADSIVIIILIPICHILLIYIIFFNRLKNIFNIYISITITILIFILPNLNISIISFVILGIINTLLYIKYDDLIICILNYIITLLCKSFIVKFYCILSTITINYNLILISFSLSMILLLIGFILIRNFLYENLMILKQC